MMKVTLPFPRILRQPLIASASTASNLLSLGMTLAAACHHWSANLHFAIGTAITCELCKLALLQAGIINWRAATTCRQFILAATQLLLAATFMMGSVGASVLCMAQAQHAKDTHDLQTSRAYASAQQALESLDAQITTLRQSADSDIAGGFRTRGLATLQRLEKLNGERTKAEAILAAHEREPVQAQSAASPLPNLLALAALPLSTTTAELLIECAIGIAIELAGFLFACGSTKPGTTNPRNPEGGPQKRKRQPLAPSPFTLQVPALKLAHPSATPPPIPPTYAKWLRFAPGPRLEAILQTLESLRCAAGCRDLLHRMGEHCLHVGWTDGTIEAATIRQDLRRGRDWRTIQGYLAHLVEAGALTFNGDKYTIEHFLTANPSTQRRTLRLAEARNQTCNRQRKLRNRLQTLQPRPQQEVDLKASCTPRNAQKPQPTSHAAAVAVDLEAAHAATHQPTSATHPHPCDSVRLSKVSRPAALRQYGIVSEASSISDSDLLDGIQRWASRGFTPREANEDADAFESELEQRELEPCKPSPPARALNGRSSKPCIPARIPANTPLVDLHDVERACQRIGLAPFGDEADKLFRRLASETVRRAELFYAAWCTQNAIKQGHVRESVVGYMLGTISRQRAAGHSAGATAPV